MYKFRAGTMMLEAVLQQLESYCLVQSDDRSHWTHGLPVVQLPAAWLQIPRVTCQYMQPVEPVSKIGISCWQGPAEWAQHADASYSCIARDTVTALPTAKVRQRHYLEPVLRNDIAVNVHLPQEC